MEGLCLLSSYFVVIVNKTAFDYGVFFYFFYCDLSPN